MCGRSVVGVSWVCCQFAEGVVCVSRLCGVCVGRVDCMVGVMGAADVVLR